MEESMEEFTSKTLDCEEGGGGDGAHMEINDASWEIVMTPEGGHPQEGEKDKAEVNMEINDASALSVDDMRLDDYIHLPVTEPNGDVTLDYKNQHPKIMESPSNDLATSKPNKLTEAERKLLDLCRECASYDAFRALFDQEKVNTSCIFDEDGWTPLHLVAIHYREDQKCLADHNDRADSSIVRLLLDHGANVNAVSFNSEKKTPLHKAVLNKEGLPIVHEFLAAGADIRAPDSRGMTPLDFARIKSMNNPKFLELMQRHGGVDDESKEVERKPSGDMPYAHLLWSKKYGVPGPIDWSMQCPDQPKPSGPIWQKKSEEKKKSWPSNEPKNNNKVPQRPNDGTPQETVPVVAWAVEAEVEPLIPLVHATAVCVDSWTRRTKNCSSSGYPHIVGTNQAREQQDDSAATTMNT
jgi:Ankyrin repeats (3 copies)